MMDGREKQPFGVTAGLIERVIFETVPAARIEEAKATKKAIFKTKCDGKSRKSDKEALQKNEQTLRGLLQAAGTNVIDKLALLVGLKMWDAKVVSVCWKPAEMSLAYQRY